MALYLICIGGKAPSEFIPQHHYDRIIAADSGYDTALSLGLTPDEVVGDLDSTAFRSDLIAKGILPSPRDKDDTDTELALKRLTSLDRYELLGGGEGRLDHTIALFASFARYSYPLVWHTACEDLIYIESEWQGELGRGRTVAFLPAVLGGNARVDAEELVWPLKAYEISALQVSLSNRTSGKTLKIHTTAPIFLSLPLKI